MMCHFLKTSIKGSDQETGKDHNKKGISVHSDCYNKILQTG